MRFIYKFPLLIALGLLLGSCEGFLDKENLTAITEDNFYRTRKMLSVPYGRHTLRYNSMGRSSEAVTFAGSGVISSLTTPTKGIWPQRRRFS